MAGSQGSGPDPVVAGVVESPAQHGGAINGTVQLASVDHAQQLCDGSMPEAASSSRRRPQCGPGRLIG